MENVMLDLETLDVRPTGVIVSIGAVFFDPSGGGRLGNEFYKVLDLDDQVQLGRTLNPSTLKWWVKQSEEARAVFDAPPTRTAEVLKQFVDFLGDGANYVKMWGNGSDFDNAMLGSLFEAYVAKAPWRYGNNRCFRTLKNIRYIKDRVILPPRTGTHHNALDDAKHQAYCALEMLKVLGEF